MKLLPGLCGLCLVVGLALLPLTHRTPAPRAPTLTEETTALRQQVARVRVQLRHAEARMAALSLKLRSSPTSRRTRLPGVR